MRKRRGKVDWGRLSLAALAAICLVACGGNEDESAGPTPTEACLDFVVATCSRASECAVETDREKAYEDCDFDFQLDFDCSAVVGVSATYGNCLQEIAGQACSDRSTLPTSCNRIFLL